MRILLDEQLPRQFADYIAGHSVRTVQQCGWAGLRNGELLRRAAAGAFQVFVTADLNLPAQQTLAGSPLCIILLKARSIRLEHLLPLVPALLSAIRDGAPGDVRIVRA